MLKQILTYKIILLFSLLHPVTLLHSQTRPTYSIGFLLDKNVEKDAEDLVAFRNEVQGVVGDKAFITADKDNVLSNEYNLARAEQNLQSMLNDKNIDIIISFGPLNNFVINKKSALNKPVIIYGQIDTDFSSVPESGRVSGIKNLTYVVVPQSSRADIEEFHNVFPFSTLGILVDEKIYDFLPNLDNILNLKFQDAAFDYKLIPFSNIPKLNDDLEGVDAVFISIGLYQTQSVYEAISDLFIEKNIPSFSTIGEITSDHGFLFSKGNEGEVGRIMRRLALNIEDIVNGVPPENIPIYMNDEREIYYNLETSTKINFLAKGSTLEKFVFIGDIRGIKTGKPYALKDVFIQVMEQNLSLQAERDNIEIAEKNTQLAKSAYLPEVTVSNTLTNTDNAAITAQLNNDKWNDAFTGEVSQVVYSQEATSGIRIAKWTEMSTRYDYNTTFLNQLSDASNAFFDALIARTNYYIEFENFELTRQNYTIAKQNYESGQTGKADVLRWESEVATCSQRFVNFYSIQHNAMDALNQQLNNAIGTRIYLVAPDTPEDIEKVPEFQSLLNDIDSPKRSKELLKILTQLSVQRAPEIQSLIANQNAALEQVKQYQLSRFIPTVALSGQYNYRTFPHFTGLEDDYYSLGLNLSLPIYQGGQRLLNKRRALVQADQLEVTTRDVETQITQNISALFQTLISDISNIHYSTKSANASKESLELMQVAYESGAVSITSLIDAQSSYITARANKETALFNFMATSLQIERSVGYFFSLHSDEENQQFMSEVEQYINRQIEMNEQR